MSKKHRNPTATVVLDCGHSNEFDLPAPARRETAYCRRCRDYRRVTNNPTDDLNENKEN